ncbi:hypothetical protein K439DRAFT_1624048 [Ramaria rubella]|nr:hypothetical protein K439DRAFT_1624048 [Ramaria rubella]
MQSQCRYIRVVPLGHDYWLAHRLAKTEQIDGNLSMATPGFNNRLNSDDPHCGSSASTIIKFSTYMDATVDDRSTRSCTALPQCISGSEHPFRSSMELHEHLCSCDDGAMSHCDSESTFKGREHTLLCPRDTSCYHYNHMIVPNHVPLRFVPYYPTSVLLNLIFLSGFLVLRANYSLTERTAQVAYSKLFFHVVPLPPSKTRRHFCAFEPQSATLRVAALSAKVLIPLLVQN